MFQYFLYCLLGGILPIIGYPSLASDIRERHQTRHTLVPVALLLRKLLYAGGNHYSDQLGNLPEVSLPFVTILQPAIGVLNRQVNNLIQEMQKDFSNGGSTKLGS